MLWRELRVSCRVTVELEKSALAQGFQLVHATPEKSVNRRASQRMRLTGLPVPNTLDGLAPIESKRKEVSATESRFDAFVAIERIENKAY